MFPDICLVPLWSIDDSNILRPRQNGCHFPDNILKCIFFNENVWIAIKISLKSLANDPIKINPTLVQIMARCWPGYKPLPETMISCYNFVWACCIHMWNFTYFFTMNQNVTYCFKNIKLLAYMMWMFTFILWICWTCYHIFSKNAFFKKPPPHPPPPTTSLTVVFNCYKLVLVKDQYITCSSWIILICLDALDINCHCTLITVQKI